MLIDGCLQISDENITSEGVKNAIGDNRLISVKINDNVISIGSYAFSNFGDLNIVSISDNCGLFSFENFSNGFCKLHIFDNHHNPRKSNFTWCIMFLVLLKIGKSCITIKY